MDRPSNSTHVASARRRTVIRAGFAAPVLATVASGSALAATSASCLAKQISAPTFPGVTTSSNPDSYLRVQLGKFTKNGTGELTYFVDGNTLANTLTGSNLTKSASYLMQAGKFQKFNKDTNLEEGSVVNAVPNNGSYTTTSGLYAVLRFDSTGQVVGVGKTAGTGMSAVSESCWSSLAP